MSQPAVPVPKEACAQDRVAQAKAPLLPKFSAELMKMLSQLVMLR